jgi:predicted secreted protein
MSDLKLDWTDRGSTYEVRVGDLIRVSLLEQGTTGYFWSPVRRPDDPLEIVEEYGPSDRRDDLPPEVLGTGSMREITFRGRLPGTSNLVIRYTRGVDTDTDITYQVRIKVGDDRGRREGHGGMVRDDV